MNIAVSDEQLKIGFSVLEQAFAFKRNIDIPLKNITSVQIEPASGMLGIAKRSWRLPGTFIPGVVRMGHYKTGDGWEFWNVRSTNQSLVVISLDNEHFKRLCLGVDSYDRAEDLKHQIAG